MTSEDGKTIISNKNDFSLISTSLEAPSSVKKCQKKQKHGTMPHDSLLQIYGHLIRA